MYNGQWISKSHLGLKMVFSKVFTTVQYFCIKIVIWIKIILHILWFILCIIKRFKLQIFLIRITIICSYSVCSWGRSIWLCHISNLLSFMAFPFFQSGWSMAIFIYIGPALLYPYSDHFSFFWMSVKLNQNSAVSCPGVLNLLFFPQNPCFSCNCSISLS